MIIYDFKSDFFDYFFTWVYMLLFMSIKYNTRGKSETSSTSKFFEVRGEYKRSTMK
jgi:hypothetical protein